jgi:F-type H+-transporting ATPase subunit delta
MVDYKVSYRYATSLLEMGEDKNILEVIADNVELILNALTENPKLRRMLENPIIKPHTKLSILKEIFSSQINTATMNFLGFLINKNREDLLYDIFRKFVELYNEKLGMVNVEVETAFEFDEEQMLRLKNRLEEYLNKKARFNFIINKNIVGGFIAKIGDTVYDASLRHQLDLLKKQFLAASLSLN